MGLGAVLVAPDGTRRTLSRSPQESGCNNEAELRALTMALEDLKRRDAIDVRVYSDSTLVVAQFGGGAEPVARLTEMFEAARMLAGGFERFRIDWIPRSRNAEADGLARAALGLGPKLRKEKHARRRA
jgi:ribonuclease HI